MNSLVSAAFELMLVGMGVVFLFLFVLTSITYLLGFLFPEREQVATERDHSSRDQEGTSPQLMAAIAIAVRKYQDKKRNAS
ncbi:MAG: oxaloacetate decarboxylase gamma subunit OadG [Idiomarinaceae bacterium HL-53]|nr:MAG: oxaloacetate decarboxylase gamma subunit OadG [Idiomarinaceae bacterium HL-53]CUS48642.1 sodium pump decarboxylases, gamma subunit [Idiomarinaceae bacterium HL-53]